MDDIELIELIVKKKDLKAYNSLMLKYQATAYKMALIYCKDRENAYDIVQDSFLKAYENLSKFRFESSFKTWLMKIVYYESLNWIKKNKKSEYFLDIDECEYVIDSKVRTDDVLVQTEKEKIIKNSLESLNKKHKTVVYLKYYENLSLKEIADIIETTEGTIKSILFRSMEKLELVLKPQMEDL
jgi:RNA polymerase sigma factor (sigma-70 family)